MASRFGVGHGGSAWGNGPPNNTQPGTGAGHRGTARARFVFQGQAVTFRSATASGSVAKPQLIDLNVGDVNRSIIGEDTIVDSDGSPCMKHANGQPAQIVASRGQGTLDEPQVIWLYDSNRGFRPLEEAAAREAAKTAKMKCIVIRRNLHSQMGKRIPGSALPSKASINTPGRLPPDLERSDWHMTVCLGASFKRLFLHGHVFCYPVFDPRPHQLKLNPADRTYLRSTEDKDKQHYEYWMMPGTKVRNSKGVVRVFYTPPRPTAASLPKKK
ncbi:hypothetical protein B0T14DRAFT_582585 [Immersiella caudata]|uniref:Uncharacterized protein n=1 Tax=Immersiella caudata TaxID=314043 RepID=A0AA39WY05_9PEZI|nr:hypothetical protein B0T14DRAFT_582585 [Immersiella caudata]